MRPSFLAKGEVTDAELAYAAGLIDGEGCIVVQASKRHNGPPTHSAQVTVQMTDEAVLLWLQSLFGGRVGRRKDRPGMKPSWAWRVCSNQALACVERLLPFARVKRAQMERVLGLRQYAFRRGYRVAPETVAARERIKHEVSALNRGFAA